MAVKRRDRAERGQSLVEFALIIPIIVLLMVGLLDLGRIVFTNNALSDGARHGARHASVDPTNCSLIADSVRSAVLNQDLATFTVTYITVNTLGSESGSYVLCQDGSPGPDSLPAIARPGDRVRVELEADLTLATPLVAAATRQDTFNLHAASTMQVTYIP